MQVEASATGLSLFQGSPAECACVCVCVSLGVIKHNNHPLHLR